MMEFVNWDDDMPNIWKVIKFMFQTTNQKRLVLNHPIPSPKGKRSASMTPSGTDEQTGGTTEPEDGSNHRETVRCHGYGAHHKPRLIYV